MTLSQCCLASVVFFTSWKRQCDVVSTTFISQWHDNVTVTLSIQCCIFNIPAVYTSQFMKPGRLHSEVWKKKSNTRILVTYIFNTCTQNVNVACLKSWKRFTTKDEAWAIYTLKNKIILFSVYNDSGSNVIAEKPNLFPGPNLKLIEIILLLFLISKLPL